MSLSQKEIEKFYDENTEAILKVIHSKNRKPVTHSKLVKRYTDQKGNDYYAFPSDMGMPVERLGELKKFMQYISKGLTAEEDNEIDNRLAKVLMSDMPDLEKKKAAGAIFTEKDKRKKLCIHTELFYNYLAVQWIRQDEQPEYYDIDIQQEKVSQFKEEVKIGGSYFFFQVPEFKKLNDMLRLSQSEWSALWRESLTQQSVLKEVLDHFISVTTSKSKAKTSKNS